MYYYILNTCITTDRKSEKESVSEYQTYDWQALNKYFSIIRRLFDKTEFQTELH